MKESDLIPSFADHLVAAQVKLYSYILTLMPWPDQASDVLQETNIVLWREAAKFTEGTDFLAWARRVAYYQVLTHRRKAQRHPVVFGDAFLESLAGQAEGEADNVEHELLVLRECIQKLSPGERQMIHRRYDVGQSVKTIANESQESPNSVAVTLFRIRQTLLKCVRGKLAEHDRE
jgi:RNA polymerase sigma-70 factor, ECF subfamily